MTTMTDHQTTLSPTAADAVRLAYPQHYLRYGECLAIAASAGIGKHTVRKWLNTGQVDSKQFNGPSSRKHYHRDSLLDLLFGSAKTATTAGDE